MVHHNHQHVIALGNAQQAAANRRTGREIEGLGRSLAAQCLDLRRTRIARVLLAQLEAVRRVDALPGLAVDRDETRAQGFVPGHDIVQRGAQGNAVELTAQAQRARDVVRHAGLGIDPGDEPQALLRRR